ncbi:hypothetical protein EDD17DRAFT_1512581 [Pisolithus thermaeus]|nr:hypothetical protein EV401DRAFT_2076075 [Pisolithus croceorrhizus]KAI6156253.1 hypothetical protein EDD17DRAFT_1512581 [Pisolithus thermaeus]
MSDWNQVYSGILSSHAGKHKEAKGNSKLRNEILAEVKVKILQRELLESVDLPCNLRVATRMEYLHQLDPQDQEEEIAVMQHILAATGKRWEDTGEHQGTGNWSGLVTNWSQTGL